MPRGSTTFGRGYMGCRMKNRKSHVTDVMQRAGRIRKNVLSRSEQQDEPKNSGFGKTYTGPT